MANKPPPDPVFVLRGVRDPINCIHFISPGNGNDNIKYLTGGTQSGQVSIWNLKTKSIFHNWAAHNSSVLWLKSLNTSTLCTLGRNDCVSLWDIHDNSAQLKTKIPIVDYLGFSQCDLIDLGNQQLICVPGPHLENVSVWDLNSSCKISQLQPKNRKDYGSVMQCKWVGFGENLYVLISYENGLLALWDWSNCKILSTAQCNDNPLSLEYDHIQKKVICGTASEKIYIFSIDPENQNIFLNKEYEITNSGVSCSGSRPDGKIYALGGWDCRIRLFSWKKHKPIAVLNYHRKSVECLDFSKNFVESFEPGYLLAAGSSDCTISLWNIFNKTL